MNLADHTHHCPTTRPTSNSSHCSYSLVEVSHSVSLVAVIGTVPMDIFNIIFSIALPTVDATEVVVDDDGGVPRDYEKGQSGPFFCTIA